MTGRDEGRGPITMLATVSDPTGGSYGTADSPPLSRRERQILRMVSTGLTSRQIATRLVLSHRTVENHVQRTLRKLRLHNRIELVRYALATGLAD